ncbi:MAG: glycosyltransferase [Nitrospirota bacterium]
MNILAILFCYPPFLLPATMCYLKLLMGLRAYGHQVSVLTVDPASYDPANGGVIDHTLNHFIPEGVINHPVPTWELHAALKLLKRFDISYRLLYRLFEPRKKEWVFPVLRYLRTIDLGPYDLILSCSQPHANHLVGRALKERTGKPWVAYFSDPWIDNPYARYRSKRIYSYNAHCEEEVITKADRVLFTSPEMLDLVMKKYPPGTAAKCGVLTHSFVPEWYEASGAMRTGERNRKVRLVHTGHFYGPRTPLPLLKALEQLHRRTDLAERLEVCFYGAMESEHKTFVERKGLSSCVRISDTIPYFDSLSVMRSADYLVLIDAPLHGAGESVFLPSKLIDYIGSYRPVIGITPERGASARVLRESGNLVCALEKEDELYEVLGSIVTASLRPSPDRTAIDRYHYLTVSKKIDHIIKEI